MPAYFFPRFFRRLTIARGIMAGKVFSCKRGFRRARQRDLHRAERG